ncbi:class I SAM-dependent methyltransferase [Paenibacillus sp. SYP-B3998]|uniref:Class I SAM-dependent methyltransferase n=1 Tax=Paenibacillus sp. SYP-B3998 TaxID=2678564 RepID=A0A6G3ZWD3_9BACL|nr:class I SAM-dependent methyltransferase [Paenibacillus sp. SYP-B3998]NEW05727.1 class I SAM-dependent methyltransferase [Paenibacillus sp. SYP-B3998]
MRDTNTPMSWEQDVYRYEETIALKIPGYHNLYDMTNRLMAVLLNRADAPANLLVIGAGGGQELLTLGSRHDAWSFTGIDPSARMLEIAKLRVERAGLKQQVTFVQGTIEQLSQELLFDGATCLLVLHFVKGLSQKRELLLHIAQRLKSGAPIFLASINGNPNTTAFAAQMEAWKSHMLDNGISLQEWERFAASIGCETDPEPASVIKELLAEAGFLETTRYFGSYLIDAWCAVKG